MTVPGLLAGFAPKRLGDELHADALLFGHVEQSAGIRQAVYDAVVVSCSLRFVDARTGKTLWHAEQWRTAHRQWSLDPFIYGGWFSQLAYACAKAALNRAA